MFSHLSHDCLCVCPSITMYFDAELDTNFRSNSSDLTDRRLFGPGRVVSRHVSHRNSHAVVYL